MDDDKDRDQKTRMANYLRQIAIDAELIQLEMARRDCSWTQVCIHAQAMLKASMQASQFARDVLLDYVGVRNDSTNQR